MTDDPSKETPPATTAPRLKAPAWTHVAAVLAALATTFGIFWWIGSMEFPEAPAGELDTVAAAQSTLTPTLDPAPAEATRNRLLIFTKTAGFRHDSIPEGIVAVTEIGGSLGLGVTATEDATSFTHDNLAHCAAVVFLNTTGDVLDDAQQRVFEEYIASGGAYVGVHSAADTEYDWSFYGNLVGAYFQKHPRIQEATVELKVDDHPATRGIDRFWNRTDEWYDYRAAPRVGVTVLATLDESSYDGGSMFGNHPIAWCQEIAAPPGSASAPGASPLPARAIYTGGGHTKESYSEPAFLRHLTGSLAWATRREIPEEQPSAEPISRAPAAPAQEPAPNSAPVPTE